MVARSWAIGTASTACASPAANSRWANASTPAGEVRWPTPIASTPGREHEHVAALEPGAVLRVAAVEQRRAGEARVVAVDRGGDRGLAAARLHRERGDRDAVAQPDARVAREEQVRQRRHDEVLRRRHPLDEPAAVAELLAREAGHEHLGELGRRQRAEPLAQPRLQRRPDRLRLQRRVEQLARRRPAPPPASARAARAGRAPPPRARAAPRRTRRARPGPARPTARRRRAARRCCAASAAAARCPAGAASPSPACPTSLATPWASTSGSSHSSQIEVNPIRFCTFMDVATAQMAPEPRAPGRPGRARVRGRALPPAAGRWRAPSRRRPPSCWT